MILVIVLNVPQLKAHEYIQTVIKSIETVI